MSEEAEASTFGDPLNSSWNQTHIFQRKSWIATELAVNLCLLLYVYILVQLVKDELNHGARQFEGSKRNARKTMGARLHRICIGAVSSDILFNITAQAYLLNVGTTSETVCNILIWLVAFVYTGSLLWTFTFLWWRQRALYANPMLRHLSTKCSLVISWISIVGFWTAFALPTVAQLFWRRYNPTPEGCELRRDLIKTFSAWYIFYTVGYFGNQLLLLWLYVHPLLVHKKRKESLDLKRRKSSGMSMSEHVANKAKQEKSFRDCILRSMVVASCCIVNDFICALGIMYVSQRNKDRWTMLILHSINLLINLLCMIVCFVYWRELLIPCCCAPAKPAPANDELEYSESSRASNRTQINIKVQAG